MVSSNRKALVIFSRIPELEKRAPEEPYAGLPWTDLDALYLAMLDDVIETASSISSVDIYVLRLQEEFTVDITNRTGKKIEVMDLPKESSGDEVQFTFEVMFGKKYEHVVLLFDPHPMLTRNDFKKAFDLLQYDDDSVVIGQHSNGKYFLLGLKADHSEVFIADTENDHFSKNQQILVEICKRELMVFPLHSKYPLDSSTNLLRLRNELDDENGDSTLSPRTKMMFKTIDKKYKIRRTR